MTEPRSDALRGARAVLPALPANLTFGVVLGVGTMQLTGSVAGTVGLSAMLFSGASQVAIVDLSGRGAAFPVVVATALLVNARYAMYSASLAPYFREYSGRWKALLSFFVVDVPFVVSITRFRDGDDVHRGWYYLGTAVPVWLAWVGGIAAGALLGTSVPDGLHLDFAFPLLFLALLFPAIEGRHTAIAAGVGAVVAVVAAGLPFNLGLLVAALVGVAAGKVTDWRAGA